MILSAPFCSYHFVHISFCPYHFVSTILSATILSATILSYNRVFVTASFHSLDTDFMTVNCKRNLAKLVYHYVCMKSSLQRCCHCHNFVRVLIQVKTLMDCCDSSCTSAERSCDLRTVCMDNMLFRTYDTGMQI